jgi:DNA-binding NtrC family response regulator
MLRFEDGMKKGAKMPGKKIVIIDDDESIRKTFFLILSKKYRVYLAGDAEEALARFLNAPIDLIIADYRLPRMGGIELIREFRRAGYSGEVILVSAYSDLIQLDELNRLSISQFFVKPLDLKAFNRSIDSLLGTREVVGKRV